MTRKNSAETGNLDVTGATEETAVSDVTEESAVSDVTEENAALDALDALATPAEVEDSVSTREIDPRIKAFVERGEERTKAAPRKWSYVTLPESEIKRVTRDAKRYARATGRVFRVKHTEHANRLVYRVVAKAATAAEATAAETAAETE